MSNLLNEYDKLLNYLQDQKKSGKLAVKQKPLPKIKQNESSSEKREEVLEKTSKLIADLQHTKYTPEKVKHSATKGFNLKYLESMMRAKLIDEHKKLNSYERPYISVSELCGCLRQDYYVRKRYPVNLNDMYRFPYLYLINRVGDKVHEVIQDLYNFSEVEKSIVSEKYKVKGRLDGIRESCIFEIKTYDDDKLEKKYDDMHYTQANIYAYILNFEYSYSIDTISLIYVRRSLKKIFSYDLSLDNSLAKSYLDRAPILLKCIENTEIPEPLGAKMQTCQYCLYKGVCEQDKFKEVPPPYININQKNKEEKIDDTKKPVFLL